jgi:hypothetical protein
VVRREYPFAALTASIAIWQSLSVVIALCDASESQSSPVVLTTAHTSNVGCGVGVERTETKSHEATEMTNHE